MNSNSAAAPEIQSSLMIRLLRTPAAPVIVAAICIGVDYMTGPFIQFPISFVIAVMLAAWFGHVRLAYFLAAAQPITRLGFIYAWKNMPWPPFYSDVNCAIRIGVLVLIAFLAIRAARQTQQLEKEVKLLEGLLPVCSYCKKIRDEGNNWQQIESYIAGHSSATFTHGICPECAEHYFGSVLAKTRKT